MPTDEAFLTVPEVAKLMRVSAARCYQLCVEGRVPHVRRGRRIFVPTAAWQRWMGEQAETAMSTLNSQESKS